MFSVSEQNGEREKLNWVYLTTFWWVYTTDWTNSLVVEINNVNTASSTWLKYFHLKKCRSIFKNIFNSDENGRISPIIFDGSLNVRKFSQKSLPASCCYKYHVSANKSLLHYPDPLLSLCNYSIQLIPFTPFGPILQLQLARSEIASMSILGWPLVVRQPFPLPIPEGPARRSCVCPASVYLSGMRMWAVGYLLCVGWLPSLGQARCQPRVGQPQDKEQQFQLSRRSCPGIIRVGW